MTVQIQPAQVQSAQTQSRQIGQLSGSSGATHFHILDGLRGVAAIAVLIFHFVELIHAGKNGGNPMPHGYLAVDFFFCLSGFVIAHAYDDRIHGIGAKAFLVNRLIRLHPLVVFGTLAGLIAYMLDPATQLVWDKLTLATIASMLLLPVVALPKRFGGIFPLNAPAWSLFFEYIISIIYAVVIIRLKNKTLVVIAGITAIMLAYTSYQTGHLAFGWNFKTFADGFWRVLFSFTAGLLIYRFNWRLTNKFGLWLPSLILIGVFVFPDSPNDWYVESLMVILVLPFVVAMGAGASANSVMSKRCKLLGDLSYPIYMSHYAVVVLFWSYVKANRQFSLADKYLLACACIVFSLLLAFVALKFVDQPIRKWLGQKRRQHSATGRNCNSQAGPVGS